MTSPTLDQREAPLPPGTEAPEFELSSSPDQMVSLAAFRGQHPAIVTSMRLFMGFGVALVCGMIVRRIPLKDVLNRPMMAALRKRRDNTRVRSTLEALKRAAEGSENTMPFLLDAVRAYATLGEICDALRSVFGTYTETAHL